MRLRSVLPLTLVWLPVACGGQPASLATDVPQPPATHLVIQPSLSPLPPRPTRTPTAAPTQPPTATLRPTAAPASPTALRAATATVVTADVATADIEIAPVVERHYVFPVQGDGEISYGKFHHDYPAADIFCPVGSVFVAVTGGVVDFVSSTDTWDPQVNDGATRGGLSVAIVGDDGVRYYGSHLSQVADGIAPGVRVAAGQRLGLTGKSGDARFTAPHLHFGISHPTTPEDWAVRRGEVAPYEYLKAWERGENVMPDLE